MQDLSIVTVDSASSAEKVSASRSRSSLIPDWLGVVASIGCAIHCAAMPFVIAFLPMLGLSFLADGSFHQVMVAVCTVLALLAFVPGWRVHRRWLPAGIATAGLVIIGVAAFGLEDSCACCTLPESTETLAATGTHESAVEPHFTGEHGLSGEDGTAGQPDAALCTDAGCAHCAAKAAADARDSVDGEPPTVLAGFAPWVTPLGGVLLIIAHLVNRRLSCVCGCCPTDKAGA